MISSSADFVRKHMGGEKRLLRGIHWIRLVRFLFLGLLVVLL